MTMTNTAAPQKRGPKPKPKLPKTRKQPTCKHCGRDLGAPPNRRASRPTIAPQRVTPKPSASKPTPGYADTARRNAKPSSKLVAPTPRRYLTPCVGSSC